MRRRPTGTMIAGISLAVVLLTAPSPSRSAEAPSPMTVDDVIALLEAGVGETVVLKQVRITRTRLIMTVETLLRLKAAGASDSLLEALVDESEDAGAPIETDALPEEIGPMTPDGRYNIRIYTEEDEDGDPVVYITNLDEDGRRMGGEIPPQARRNVVAEGEPWTEASPYEPALLEDPTAPIDYPAAAGPPVTVNVYPPSDPTPEGAHAYGGFYPVISYPAFPLGYYGRYTYPRPYGYSYSPPGSYSHYINHHQPPGAHRFGRYHFTTYGARGAYRIPAHQRNRALFENR